MEPRDGRLDLLRRVPGLGQLNDDDLARVAVVLAERELPAGEVLVREGTAGDQSFLVIEGSATVTVDGSPIAAVGPGEFVGEMALLDDEPRCATVIADTPLRLLVLDKASLTSLLDPISEALLGTMARRLRRATSGASSAATTSAATPGPSPAGGHSTRGEWRVGAEVEVRSRYTGRWVRGFALADVESEGPSVRLQLRRLSDGAVLPLLFQPEDVRPS